MVTIGVDVVDADRVCAQLLHESSVAFALGGVNERVIGNKLVCDSCRTVLATLLCDFLSTQLAFEEELHAIAVEELGALDRDGGNGIDDGQSRQQAGQGAEPHCEGN